MDYKTAMKLLAGTEAVFFLSLMMAFVYLVYFTPALDNARQLNLRAMSLFSALLFASSGSYRLAEHYYKKKNMKGVKRCLLITILLGAVFLFGEGWEYYELIHKQVTISQGIFGASFYTLTGFHGLHVLVGLIILSVLLALFMQGDFSDGRSSAIAAAGIYWHFVDVVWFFVFGVVYVIPVFL